MKFFYEDHTRLRYIVCHVPTWPRVSSLTSVLVLSYGLMQPSGLMGSHLNDPEFNDQAC